MFKTRSRKGKYFIVCQSARCVRIAHGTITAARKAKMLTAVDIMLTLKAYNVHGRIMRGQISSAIKSASFSAATFWRWLPKLIEMRWVLRNDDGSLSCASSDTIARFFDIDPKVSKIIKVPVRVITAQLAIAYIDRMTIVYNKQRQRTAIITRQRSTPTQQTATLPVHGDNAKHESQLCCDPTHVNHGMHDMRKCMTYRCWCGKLVDNRKLGINRDINCSLRKYAQLFGVSSQRQARTILNTLQCVGWISVRSRNGGEYVCQYDDVWQAIHDDARLYSSMYVCRYSEIVTVQRTTKQTLWDLHPHLSSADILFDFEDPWQIVETTHESTFELYGKSVRKRQCLDVCTK